MADLKTKYKYIHFEKMVEFDALTDKPVYVCKNNSFDTLLAQIFWYDVWKQYVADFSRDAVFSADCLDDISAFLAQLR